MTLTPEQQQTVAGWIADGKSISDVQNGLRDDFGLNLTFMDVRFLIDDLDLELVRAAPDPVEEDAEPEVLEPEPMPAGLSVEVDRVTQPGTMVSGSVTFSDGEKATWSVDQFGRLGLNPTTAGYQPSPEDIQQFQVELQKAVSGPGF